MNRVRLPRTSRTYLFLIFAFALLSLFYLNHHFTSRRHQFDLKNTFYSIVIDAGSTGTRIHVYKIKHDDDDDPKFPGRFDAQLLNEELVVKIKPGLSSYHKEPIKASESIRPLLNQALGVIPTDHQAITRISLRATAGLRLISNDVANLMLENINKLFHTYPFVKTGEDAAILDGRFEGIYSWLTLNYALDSFKEGTEKSICSLDLGGGSNQITFVPSSQVTIDTNKEFIVDFKLDQTNYKMFAKSFLGFGLMSARMSIFEHDTSKFLNAISSNSPKSLSSVCLPSGFKSTWLQQSVEYAVLGPATNEEHSFEKCQVIANAAITNKVSAPAELRDKDIYAFSYFFDRMDKAKLFAESKIGGVISLAELLERTKAICNDASSSETYKIDAEDVDYAFLCMDLTFMYSMLSQGFGLPDDKKLHVYKEVNKMEITWALGAAFHMVKY